MPQGLDFELRVYEAIKVVLEFGDLGLLPTSCRVFHRKGYHSRERNDTIIVDVSVEINLSEANEPSIIWIWECKDYSSSVPVSDIEEFHAKLQQIGADKTKGTVIASGSFQRSAIEFARSNGIGIARLLPDNQVLHIAFRGFPPPSTTANTIEDALRFLTLPEVESVNSDFFGITGSGRVEQTGDIFGFMVLELTENRE